MTGYTAAAMTETTQPHAPHSLVVGGAAGLGLAAARALAGAGHRVSVLDLNPPPGDAGSAMRHVRADLLSPDGPEAALAEAVAGHGPINHALFMQRYRGGGADPWEGELAVSLGATRRIVEWLAPRFPESQDCSLLFAGSAAGRFVATEQPAGYHAAKAALAQLARYWAVTLGPRGVRSNCVSPAVFVKEERRELDLERYRRIAQAFPLRRVPTAEQIARVIAFLCSPAASCLTGQDIAVDNGLSLLAHASLAAGPPSP